MVSLKAYNGQYVCAENGGGSTVVANRASPLQWETFELLDLGNDNVAFKTYDGLHYLCADATVGHVIVADRHAIGPWEIFKKIDLGNGNIALQAYNGKYVCAEGGGGRELVANRNAIGSWETFKLITKKALIVGINAYPTAPLDGCLNDVADYVNTLTPKGFVCTTLTDGMATKARILTELRNLITSSSAGDSLVFTFSGHGSYLPDHDGDEADQRDEILVSIDYLSGQYIYDDEIRAETNRLPAGVVLEVFAGACFSGTVTRFMGKPHRIPMLGIRYMKVGKNIEPSTVAKAVIVPGLNHVLWASTRDDQYSWEFLINGVPRGGFDYHICKTLREHPEWNRNQIMEYVKERIASVVSDQIPQLECTEANAAKLPFT